jgi:predicted DNA-binding protein (MmcQ/YjbR family)
MDNERIREICLGLPHVTEVLNWGSCLCYFVGARELGGKMFALIDTDGLGPNVLAYAAGPERCCELLEIEGIVPAPHLARAYWVAVERWDVLRPRQFEEELRLAHGYVLARLAKRTRALLDLPERERNRLIRQQKSRPPSKAKKV